MSGSVVARSGFAVSVALGMLAAALVGAPATFAQDSAAQIPAHPRDLEFPDLSFDPPSAGSHRHVLPSGVVVFVVEDHELPLVNIALVVRSGSYMEPDGKQGVASLTGEQMRSGGTTSLPPAELDEELDFLAAQLGTYVGDTQAGANLNVLTKDLDRGLALFFEVLREPRFDSDRLELAKSQSLQSMQRRNDSTQRIEGREWARLMRGDAHFSTHAPTEESLGSITREDLLAFHERAFRPGDFVFAVSGDIETADILSRLEGHIAAWGTEPVESADVPRPDFEPTPGLYLVHKDGVNQGRVSIGHLGTTRENPDHYALQVMNDILGGGGFTSRILSRIRSDEGLAYNAGSGFGLGTWYEGIFRADFQSRSETVARAAAIVLEEIDRIREEPVSDQELADAKASFIETFPRRFSSAGAIAGLFARDEIIGRPSDYWESYRRELAAVTVEDIQRVAREYLHLDRLVILAVGDVDAMLAGDPDNPEVSLEGIAPGGVVVRIPLPDPMTMEYPREES